MVIRLNGYESKVLHEVMSTMKSALLLTRFVCYLIFFRHLLQALPPHLDMMMAGERETCTFFGKLWGLDQAYKRHFGFAAGPERTSRAN